MAYIPIVGRGESFEAFYRREFRSVLGLAVILSGNASTAEELAQDAFLAALRRWEEVSVMDSPGGWVRSVVANRSVSRFRRLMVQGKALLKLRPQDDAMEAVQTEARLDLWQAVRRLPKRQAQAVALTYLDGLSRSETAAVLGCSEETVKTHLARARSALRAQLGDLGGN